MKKLIILSLLLVFGTRTVVSQSLSSPNGLYTIIISGMTYRIDYRGKTIVEDSRLGVDIDNRLLESALAVPRGEFEDWSAHLILKGEERSDVDTTWVPLYGENATIRNHYNQLVLHYEKGSNGQRGIDLGYDKRKYYAMDIIVRAYDEGIAFRYHFPETSNGLFLHITGERTQFSMPVGTMAYYEEWAQGPYEYRPLSGSWFESERPLLMKLSDGTYVALLEAAMKDYVRGKFKLAADNVLQIAMYDCADVISPYDTPWRVVMAANRAVDLINHKDLVLNLNEERCGQDWSWVRPGKAFRSGRLDKEGIFRSIDYCKQFGIDYVELDAGWYGAEGKVASDARQVSASRDFTIPEVCAYARQHGIGVWLYVNQRALYRQLNELLPLYQAWGVSGIKFGFVQIGNQQWSTWLHQAIAQCAKYHLMVDVHDEYRPTGLSRTYPHLLTQEGVRGNEEMPDAAHNTLLPFTRYLCGPADYTLCYFNNRLKTTKGHQLAMAAVYYSPLQFYFWYDNPFVDKGEPELQFWKACPTVFDESRALEGEPGEYIVQARRSGKQWFVGCMTNGTGRTLNIPTDFLPAGKYQVQLFYDDPSLDSRTKVRCKKMHIKRGATIAVPLQPHGGAALIISK